MSKYFALLTRLGADRLANAAALGTKIEITHMAVGDGNGSLPTPDSNQTKLINEKRRAAINVLSIDPKNTHQIIAEQVIPEHEGGWWIREIGLFDKNGVLMAVANCAETYKPQLQEGSGRTQTIRMVLIVSHTDAVTLKIDPSVVLATREYADAVVARAISEHEKSRRHPAATLKEKGFVVLNNATDSNSETQAATPKAVKVAYDLANAANQNANSRVPTERKVNGKVLSTDILLNAGDVGAYTTKEIDSRIEKVKELANKATQNATDANDNANRRLDKAQNGADIEDKNTFINNLGLRDTVDRAHHSLDRRTGGEVNGDISSQGNLSVQKDISAKGKMSADDGFFAGTAALTPWGDIRGTQWGNGWLSHWLNDRLAEKPSAKFMEDSQGWWLDPTTGIILQWGKLAPSGRNFNFPRAFPVECFHVFVTNNTSQGSRIDNAFGYPVNNHQFYASTKSEGGNDSGHPVAWWAIGR
ncbi:phage tail protein [Xenorhabdus budapestensis]|uniref:Phage tail protein n=1 Tax=Xenorhabdus budapestensis TaxID=290110 RepID=A0ABX7VEY6_XENBU|nr:phage tail protein [Xenorhabdus budapestensis]QTL38491.1 phage tail protein [Xenorhabdus budapestensis]